VVEIIDEGYQEQVRHVGGRTGRDGLDVVTRDNDAQVLHRGVYAP